MSKCTSLKKEWGFGLIKKTDYRRTTYCGEIYYPNLIEGRKVYTTLNYRDHFHLIYN